MFRILLINPPRDHLVHLNTKANVDLGEIASFPPIGLMYLAQGLRMKNPAFEVRILDAVVDKLTLAQVLDQVKTFSPRIVGITATTYTFYDVWRTAVEIKKHRPELPIAVGGAHMYIFGEETMTHRSFDYGVVGDGEEVFAGLCEELSRKETPAPAKGLYFREKGRVRGEGIAEVEDLDSMAYPAVDLISPEKYYSAIGAGKAVGTICASRGCPFRCTFCQVPQARYRARSIANVLREVEAYRRVGITDFFFFDDLFNITVSRVTEFCEAVLERGLKIGWMFRGRADQIDGPMLELARRAGCHSISVGIEDATDAGLKAIKKNISIDRAFEAVRLIRKHKIACSTNWIIGFPRHKTLHDLNHLLETALKMDADYAQFSILQCLPGSELYEQAVREGGIDPQAWRGYVLKPTEVFHPPIWEKHFSERELYDFYERAYRKYYMRPKFVWRELRRIRSWPEAAHQLRSFVKIFVK